MNHYHLIYTPKELEDIKIEALPYDKYVAAQEMGQGGRHWHIYIQTDYAMDKIRDTLKDVQKIPKGKKGKQSLYYSCREIAEHPELYPDQDLRKFTLGYILKNQSLDDGHEIMKHKGFKNEDLVEAYAYYQQESAKTYKPPEALKEQLQPEKDGLQAEWADYMVFIEKEIKKYNTGTLVCPPNTGIIRRLSRVFWSKRNNGLFPPYSKYNRFLGSIIYYLRHQMSETEDEALEKTNY